LQNWNLGNSLSAIKYEIGKVFFKYPSCLLKFHGQISTTFKPRRSQNQSTFKTGRPHLFNRTSSIREISTTPTVNKKSGFATNLPDIANTISSKNEQHYTIEGMF